jgi:hypothetical protein
VASAAAGPLATAGCAVGRATEGVEEAEEAEPHAASAAAEAAAATAAARPRPGTRPRRPMSVVVTQERVAERPRLPSPQSAALITVMQNSRNVTTWTPLQYSQIDPIWNSA